MVNDTTQLKILAPDWKRRLSDVLNFDGVVALTKAFPNNKSLLFFKEKDTFDIEKFANEVIEQPEVIEKFHQYKRAYEEECQIAIDDQFTISESARKKQQRSYKRVIRLDQKIQIIIDGNRENVEQGEDEKGKFYKVYYRQEM